MDAQQCNCLTGMRQWLRGEKKKQNSSTNNYSRISFLNSTIIINKIQSALPSSTQLQMKVSSEVSATTINSSSHSAVEKSFLTRNNRLHYTNNYYLKQANDEASLSGHIAINNILCQKTEDDFKKITEIRIGNKVIVLQDFYRIDELMNPQMNLKKNNSEDDTCNVDQSCSELQIKNKQESSMSPEFYKRKDKKNIVKNIIKSYLSFLKLSKGQDLGFDQHKQMIQNYLTSMKFNNQLVVNIINNPKLVASFEYFLKNQARVWLQESKINDKNSHIEAIDTYLKACVTGKPEILRVLKRN